MSCVDISIPENDNFNSPYFNWRKLQGTAVRNESITMVNSCQLLSNSLAYSATELLADPLVKFHSLKLQWENEINFLSSTNEICMHPAYQQIIGMGKAAIPFIINELSIKPNHWFWALKAISGQDPVPISKRGRIKEMAKQWIAWWSKNQDLV